MSDVDSPECDDKNLNVGAFKVKLHVIAIALSSVSNWRTSR